MTCICFGAVNVVETYILRIISKESSILNQRDAKIKMGWLSHCGMGRSYILFLFYYFILLFIYFLCITA